MNKQRPGHAAQTQFPVVGDCLQIGGIPLTRLAQRVGRTPFYAYDRSLLTERVRHVKACMPEQLKLHYSIKANPMPALVQHMAGLVDGLDVASGGELSIALDTPIEPSRISFAGPAKSDAELVRAIASGVMIHVESERELQAVARGAEQLGITPALMLRVNPDFELRSSGMRMGGGPKQFGIDAEQVPRILNQAHALGLDFSGFHIFSGSQSLNTEAIIEAQAKTCALVLHLARHAPQTCRIFNIGGGFGIPYFPGEHPLDLRRIGEHLEQWMSRIDAELGNADIVIELGRYLVGEAGVYIARVVDRKISRGQVFLVTDGGLHHHLAASGNFGQVIRKNYPVLVGNKVVGEQREIASVVGPLCTPLDLLADQMDMACAEPGDLIAVLQSGAYGLTASPQGFLGHPRPEEVLV